MPTEAPLVSTDHTNSPGLRTVPAPPVYQPILIGLIGPVVYAYAYFTKAEMKPNTWVVMLLTLALGAIRWWAGEARTKRMRASSPVLAGRRAVFGGTARRLKVARPKPGFLFLTDEAVISSLISTGGLNDDVVIPLSTLSIADLSMGRLRLKTKDGGDWLLQAEYPKLWVKEINDMIASTQKTVAA